jgi:hypothetical protein
MAILGEIVRAGAIRVGLRARSVNCHAFSGTCPPSSTRVLVNSLAFTSAYFSESSLFNGLWAMSLRKSLPCLGLRVGLQANVSNSHGFSFSRRSTGEREIDSNSRNA